MKLKKTNVSIQKELEDYCKAIDCDLCMFHGHCQDEIKKNATRKFSNDN